MWYDQTIEPYIAMKMNNPELHNVNNLASMIVSECRTKKYTVRFHFYKAPALICAVEE